MTIRDLYSKGENLFKQDTKGIVKKNMVELDYIKILKVCQTKSSVSKHKRQVRFGRTLMTLPSNNSAESKKNRQKIMKINYKRRNSNC